MKRAKASEGLDPATRGLLTSRRVPSLYSQTEISCSLIGAYRPILEVELPTTACTMQVGLNFGYQVLVFFCFTHNGSIVY